ncbi:hypothetical protein CBR_g40093 [Chara braunii]|uniref:Bifunctional inhibitor/plant lipid transfer protein/seed storage helical domain-containing protein n=1 Tax=Chara braunii TaxID=69332 RepID=A0A388JL87_CHABU|nr:hypothetical protein CBR_g81588 [Chara braunii]GBG85451.1 hypothetical protein CBR_g40093 [Chara braunii]|eukprot:GBG47903.1 hypothetical protein CBR_g81588 [Chara braunii]
MLLLFACSLIFNDLQCARGQEEDTYTTPTFPGYCSTAVPRLPWASLQEVCTPKQGPFTSTCCEFIKGMKDYEEMKTRCGQQIAIYGKTLGYDVRQLASDCSL